jgi:drug/metabolite transporter (DMT)-like permease
VLAAGLALSASLAWGIADFLAGLESRRIPLLAVLLGSQLAGLAVIAAVVALAGGDAPGGEDLAFGALSGLAGIAALAAFYRGLAVGAMAVVAPIAATAAAIPVAVGIATGERPGPLQLAGIAIALAGVALAAREKPPEGAGARLAAGVPYALVAALGFGCFFLAIDRAGDGGVAWATLANRVTSVTLLALAVVALRPPLRAGLARARVLAVVGALDVSANLLFAYAASEGLVSLASVLASLYPVVVIALARIALGERVQRVQQAGAAGALVGVALIAGG